MKGILKNWKTTLTGLASIGAGVILIIKGQVEAGATSVISGLGLIFAKDNDVTV